MLLQEDCFRCDGLIGVGRLACRLDHACPDTAAVVDKYMTSPDVSGFSVRKSITSVNSSSSCRMFSLSVGVPRVAAGAACAGVATHIC